MQWRSVLRQFGVRFAICFVALGGVYLAFFGHSLLSHNKPASPAQKIMIIRAALDQTYIAGSALLGFKQSDVLAGDSLAQLVGQLQTSNTALATAIKHPPAEVSQAAREKLQDIVDRQKQAVEAYQRRLKVFSKPISYDPEAELGTLDLSNRADEAARRALAAKTGLTRVADDTTSAANSSNLSVRAADSPDLLVPARLKQALLVEAGCFGRLADQLNAHSVAKAIQTRTSCLKNYPSLRGQVIQTVVAGSFSSAFGQTVAKSTPPLLKQLDQLGEKAAK